MARRKEFSSRHSELQPATQYPGIHGNPYNTSHLLPEQTQEERFYSEEENISVSLQFTSRLVFPTK